MENNVLEINNRQDFRKWLAENHASESECWLNIKRGKPTTKECFWYIDAVEEALCFGWIDSTYKLINGIRMQRFSPRKKNSPWSELNKERVRRLEKLGMMTDSGREVLPDMNKESFRVDKDIEKALKDAGVWDTFTGFPPLYQRVRAYNVSFYKKKDPSQFEKSLKHLIEETEKGKMFGEWNDYGRLADEEND